MNQFAICATGDGVIESEHSDENVQLVAIIPGVQVAEAVLVNETLDPNCILVQSVAVNQPTDYEDILDQIAELMGLVDLMGRELQEVQDRELRFEISSEVQAVESVSVNRSIDRDDVLA